MYQFIIKWMSGFLHINITGEETARFLSICAHNGITMSKIEIRDQYTTAYISKRDYSRLAKHILKTGVKVEIEGKYGLPYFFYRYKKRKCFIIGLILYIIAIYVFSLFIWDISITGYTDYTKEELLDEIVENYVGLGTLKSNINCNEIETELRKKYENIGWVSCEIKGTQLNIVIKETSSTTPIILPDTPCSLVATKDCTVTEIITRAGIPLVKAGEVVKKGDVLITGNVDIVNEYDELIDTEYVVADGDVIGTTVYEYDSSFDMTFYKKEYTGNEKTFYRFLFGDNLYTPYEPDYKYEHYDIISDEKQLKIGTVYYLPISRYKVRVREYIPVAITLSEDKAIEKANFLLKVYIDKLEKKGVEIIENNVTIEFGNQECHAYGRIVVNEPVAVWHELEEHDIAQDIDELQ